MKKPLVVYHGPSCLDGMAAAWAMYFLLGNSAEYIVGHYQTNDKIDFADREVFLVDFSYPRTFLEERILPVARKVVLIDHHKSALEELRGLSAPNFDMSPSAMDKSGAMLTWEYVVSQLDSPKSTPYLIRIIQDRDLWKFELPETKAVTAALFSKDLTYKTLGKLMWDRKAVTILQRQGEVLLAAHDKECLNLIKCAQRIVPLQVGDSEIRVVVVNAPPKYSSNVGNILSKDHPLAMTYWDSANHREFSLRSNAANPEHVDVSAIAKLFGGGGHKHAAGFKVPRNHPLAMV